MTELCFSVKSSSHGLYESHDSCRFSLGIVHSRFIQWNDELLGFGSPSGLRREVAMIQYQSAWCPYCEVLSIGVFRTRRGFGWLRRKLCIHLVRILYWSRFRVRGRPVNVPPDGSEVGCGESGTPVKHVIDPAVIRLLEQSAHRS